MLPQYMFNIGVTFIVWLDETEYIFYLMGVRKHICRPYSIRRTDNRKKALHHDMGGNLKLRFGVSNDTYIHY